MNPNNSIKKVLTELGFRMEYQDKVSRAVFGLSTAKGFVGGVGEDASASDILAAYDKIGGYITRKGYKVKNGCFFDAKTGFAVKEPKIILLIKMNGTYVEYQDGAEESLEMKVARKQFEEAKKQQELNKKEQENKEAKEAKMQEQTDNSA